jgi:hypothetical protein
MESTDGNILELTWRRTLVVWWALLWRSVLFSGLLGAVLGFVGGTVVALRGRPDLSATVGRILGQLGTLPISLVVLRVLLRKAFKEFSVRLIATHDVN